MKRRKLLSALMVATLVCATTGIAGDAVALKGNKKSKVYHRPTCRYYTAKGSTVEFKTELEATQAGYKACKQCAKPKSKKKTPQAK